MAKKMRKGRRRRSSLAGVIQKRGRWYVAYVEEIPGVNTQGRTLAEARRNLKEAVRLVLEANRGTSLLGCLQSSPDSRLPDGPGMRCNAFCTHFGPGVGGQAGPAAKAPINR